MKNQIINWGSVVLIVGGGISLFSYIQVRSQNKWLRETIAEQPIWNLSKEHPYPQETQIKLMRVMNDFPILPVWTVKEANELVEFFNTPYTEKVFDQQAADWDDVGHMALSAQAMATAALRMSKSGPIDKDAANIIKQSFLAKLNSWSRQDRSCAIACLASSGLMIHPDVIQQVVKLENDPDTYVARLAKRNVTLCSRPEYIKEWQYHTEKRGY